MKLLVAATAMLFLLAHNAVCAAALLSEQQARAKAVNILKGDPYGRTQAEVTGNIWKTKIRPDDPM